MTNSVKRKGIILAGGKGTRLYPLTKSISKQLLPVYDKPMIYYPLTTLILAGISEILIVSSPRDLPSFKQLMGNGRQWGLELSYAEQLKPEGIAQALLIGAEFISGDTVALILGDNFFYAKNLKNALQEASAHNSGATIFGYYVKNPSDYGIVSFDKKGTPESIIEKPKISSSSYAVTGLYFYDNSVLEIAKELKPSLRGELEITDVNSAYLKKGNLRVEILSSGTAWLDAGEPNALLDAANFVRIVEERQGLKIGCPEEVAYLMKLIDFEQMEVLIKKHARTSYGDYLADVLGRPAFEDF